MSKQTARSSVFNLAHDYSTALFNHTPEMILQGQDIPIHLGSLIPAMKSVAKYFEGDIHDGDLIVVEQQPNANVGEIVVAIVDNEFTVKYLDREKGTFVLKPANKAFPVIRPKGRLEIFGVMAGLVRRTR